MSLGGNAVKTGKITARPSYDKKIGAMFNFSLQHFLEFRLHSESRFSQVEVIAGPPI